MRTRNKVVVQSSVSVGAAASNSCNNVSTSISHSPTTWTTPDPDIRAAAVYNTDYNDSTMVDQVGNHPNPGYVLHRSCHVQLRGTENRTTSPAADGYAGWRYIDGLLGQHYTLSGQTNDTNALKWSAPSWVIPGVTVTWARQSDSKVIASLYDRATRPVVDGLLNVVEAPELPAALKSLGIHTEHFRSVRYVNDNETFGQWWKRVASRKSLKKRLRGLSGGHLAYSFAIAPLISDSQKVYQYLDRLSRDYQRYARGDVKRVVASFAGNFAFSKAGSGANSYQGYCTHYPATRYVLTYRERNPYKTEFFRRLDFLLRRFGSSGPVGFAWERIPFSFVVDWFVDVGSLASNIDRFIDPRIETLSLTKSNKFVCVSDVFRTIKRTDTNTVVYGPTRQGSVTHKYYERTVLGRRTTVQTSEKYGKRQWALTMSLLLQSLTGRRTR